VPKAGTSKPQPPPKAHRLASTRSWLKTNKVFFDTVAATCLAVASITVAILQTGIASRTSDASEKQNALLDKQNALVTLQSRITEAQAMPTFDIKIHQLPNDAGRADDNVLTIDNSGGPVHEFYARAIYILEITAGEKKIPYPKPVHLRIPVNDYYSANAVTAASKGHLATIFGHGNNLAFITFSRALSASSENNNWNYANTEEITFLHIEYTDILNRPHDEYYGVAPVSGSRIISNDEGRAVFEEAAPMKRINLGDLTVDKVAQELSALMKAAGP
jgi:hypothetical protein